MSAGNFTCAELAEVQLKADAIWADNAAKKDYIAEVQALTCLRANQTATLTALQTEKDNQVKIAWIKDCDETIEDCTDECTVGGAEAEAACDTHTLDLCKKVGFTVNEKTFRTSIFSKDEVIARQMLRKMKLLDEYLAQQAVTVINASAGVNAYTGGKGQVSGANTYILPTYWDASLFSYLSLVSKLNKFASSWILSGTNLYEAWMNASFNAQNANGQGAKNMFDSFNICYDVFNVDTVLTPDKKTFLIDKGALAFANKAYWPVTPIVFNGSGLTKYQVESKNLPGVFYDVTVTDRCVSNEIYHDFSIQVKAGIFLNPKGCDTNNTGVLSFVCGSV